MAGKELTFVMDTLREKSLLITEKRGGERGLAGGEGGEGDQGLLQGIGVNSAKNQQSNGKQSVGKSQE
jgi:hypothetical protein